MLSPSRTAAVCGGNVLTSQRIVDVVLKAFHACSASQGCTNNLTFGAGGKDADGNNIAGWGYYEVRFPTPDRCMLAPKLGAVGY